MRSRYLPAVGVVLTALALASCAPAAPSEPASTTTPAAAPSTQPPATVTSAPEDSATPTPDADPSCDTIISSGTVDALTSQGWTSMEEEFRIGETVVEGGLMCMWADFSTASDHGQMYASGPISDAAADAAKTGLQRDGWMRSQDGDSVFFTEDPAYAIATDADGFGMTYEFSDGWVTFADTKQGLLLIAWKG